MAIFRLERGLVVRRGEQTLAFHRRIDDTTLQFEDVLTGTFSTYQFESFLEKVNSGSLRVVNPGGGSEPIVSIKHIQNGLDVVILRLTDKQRKAWERKCHYVRALRKRGVTKGQREQISHHLTAIAEAIGDVRLPSISTLLRWMREFERQGENNFSLISGHVKRINAPRLNNKLREIIHEKLRKYYFIRNGESLRKIRRRVEIDVEKIKDSALLPESVAVSDATVRRIAAETDPYHRDRARFGAAYAAARWRHSTGGIYAVRPLQRVEMDHTVLDLYVLDDTRGIPLGRPTITILVDSYSGYILSLYISFEGGSIGRMAQAIKFALQPKAHLVEKYGLNQEWHVPGLWETLVLDNSLEFHSSHLRSMSMELCCDLEYCPVRKPWFKPGVERTMLELARVLPIKGRPEKFMGIKDVIDPQKAAVITFSELCRCLVKWAVDVHPLQVNDRKLARPLDLLQEGLAQMPAPMFVDDLRSLDVIGGIEKTMRVRHSGIEMLHLTYRSQELADMAREIAPSFPVKVKMNADDLGSVWVQHPKQLRWINVPATHSAYANGLTLFQHKLIRAQAKNRLKDMGAAEALLQAQAQLQEMWDVATVAGRKLKGSSKKLAMLEGTRSSQVFMGLGTNEPIPAERVITREELVVESADVPDFASFRLDTFMR